MAPIPPSGRQYVITQADQRAVVTEVGGGLRRYSVAEHDVLDGYAESEICSVARGAPLLPWPNRLQDGRYDFGGETLQTAITEPSRQNAIHGLTRWLSWRGFQPAEDRVTMRLLLHPQDGYPFTLSLAIEYRLSSDGLAVRTTATNLGTRALPYGAGHHPYLTVGTDRIDDALLSLPAALRLEVDDRQIPTCRLLPVDQGDSDFRTARRIADTRLDTAFTGLIRDADGMARVGMRSPDGRRSLTLWMDGAHDYLMVFTGDTIPDQARRRRGLAVEPMTCAPNAFRNRLGLVVLEPEQSLTTSWGIFATA
jgi:aldose 1-epimerase